MRTAALHGALLDFWVDRLRGVEVTLCPPDQSGKRWAVTPRGAIYSPTTDASIGLAIIESEGIAVHKDSLGGFWSAAYRLHGRAETNEYSAELTGEHLHMHERLLTAAMRSFVQSKCGSEVADA